MSKANWSGGVPAGWVDFRTNKMPGRKGTLYNGIECSKLKKTVVELCTPNDTARNTELKIDTVKRWM